MSKMHLRQPWYAYSACRSFTKNKERIQKFKETGDSQYIYQNELEIELYQNGKACFQHGMAYGDFKGLSRRTTNIAKYFLVNKHLLEQPKMKLCLINN